jgi:ubiquinone/menaquinone biosynthesis C-methylase UbiE
MAKMKGGRLIQKAQTKPAVYDRLAHRYDRAVAPLERRFLARWRAQALNELPTASRILEVGAGTGLNFPFYPQGAQVWQVKLVVRC